jgi:drug/metabolite transporter (DMT)-like permease
MTLKQKFTDLSFSNPIIIGIMAIICTLLWGSAFPCVKIGYELFQILPDDIPSKILFAGYRFTLAGIIVILFHFILERRLVLPRKTSLPSIFILGLIQTTFQYILFYIGLSNTTGVKGSILNSLGTFVIVFLAHFFYKNDTLTVQKVIGAIIGIAGVILINLQGGEFTAGFNFMGDGLLIIASFMYAIAFLYSKHVTTKESPIIVTGYQLFLGGALLILTGLLSGGHLSHFSTASILMLIYLALLSSIAFTLWTQLLKYNPVGKVSVYNFLTPIFGVILSSLFLGEKFFTITNVIALCLVSCGIFIVNKSKI